jgi:TatA/E family protein of Tat protein translocase
VPSSFIHDALQSLSPETRLFRHSRSGKVYSDNSNRKVKRAVFAFILEGLGSTELIFILVVALIFFGPRKLPQLARSMGKGLSEFRKASDDFKRTWEREVALESARTEDNSILESEERVGYDAYEPAQSVDQPVLEPANSELVVARASLEETTTGPATSEPVSTEPVSTEPAPEPVKISSETAPPESQPVRKQDWL